MSKPSPRTDAQALNKLVKVATMGSVLVVLVYSIYYYSQAYKMADSKFTDGTQKDFKVLKSMSDTLQQGNNIYTAVTPCMLRTVNSDFNAYCKPADLYKPVMFYTNGFISKGIEDSFNMQMNRRFTSAPPVYIDPNNDFVLQGLHFQHWEPSYHVQVNWKNDEDLAGFPFSKFQEFVSDSIASLFYYNAELQAFRIERPEEEDAMYVQALPENYAKVTALSQFNSLAEASWTKGRKGIHVKMPIPDFELRYHFHEYEGIKVLDESESVITSAMLVVKLLAGPSLKLNRVYTIDDKTLDNFHIKPPFLLALKKNDQTSPYFFAVFGDSKLLLE